MSKALLWLRKKSVQVVIVALILATPCSAFAVSETVQVLMGGNASYISSNSASRYLSIFGMANVTWSTAATSGTNPTREIISASGTFRRLVVKASYALGAGSYAIVFIKNGAVTDLTCTVTSPATTCSDNTNTVRVAPGDSVEVRYTGSGSPGTTPFSHSVEFVPDVQNETLLGATVNNTTNGSYGYANFFTRSTFPAAEASTTQSLLPIGGRISNARFSGTNAPGTGTSFAYALRINQATSSLICTLTDTNKQCSDTVNYADVTPNSWADISAASTSAATLTGVISFGYKFTPSTIGQFFFMGGSGLNNQGTATTYLPFSGNATAGATTTQVDFQMVANAMTITGFTVGQTNTTGASGTRTYTLEVNGVPTAATCSTTGTTGVNSRMCSWSGSITVNQGDLLDYIDTVTGTVTNARVYISTVAIRPPDVKTRVYGGFLKVMRGFLKIK